MKRELGILITVGMIVFACGTKDDSKSADEPSGAYVREYSFKVVNPETGAEIGMRTIRDTILIRPVEEKFEITNHKWGKNDYDNDGWRNMEHAEDRPFRIFQASYNSGSRTFSNGQSEDIYLSSDLRILGKNEKLDRPYSKTQ